MQLGRDTMVVQLPVKEKTVHDRNYLIIVCMKKDASWCFTVDVELIGEELHQFFRLVFSQQDAAQSGMAGLTVKADDGIDQDKKVGSLHPSVVMYSQRGCQMTAGRKSHDPHLRRVDSPGVGIFPNHPDGTLCIFQGCQGVGYSGLFTRKPVLEKKGGNALPGKPLCHLAPFPFHEQGVITTTGADDHGTFQLDPLLGDKEERVGLVTLLTSSPKRESLR